MIPLRSLSIRYSLLAFGIALSTVATLMMVEVTIIVDSPDIGDVSNIVQIAIGSIATLVGIISGGITIYNFVSGSDERRDDGPTDHIVVEGDLHYHLGDPTFTQKPAADQMDESETNDDPETESEE